MNPTMTKPTLSDRISNLEESATLQMAALARQLQAEGKDVISLSLGEPDFDTPEHIREAAKKAIDERYSHYTPVPGYMELREAVCTKFKRDNNLDYTPDQIVTSTGAKQSIANLIFCLVNPGDEVILPAPYWVSYAAQVQLAEGKIVEIPSSIHTDFKVTPEQLDAAITEKTKVVLFSSPCNPSGAVYSKEELRGIAEVVAKYDDLYILADEIYEHINFIGKHESIGQFDFIKDRVVTINGLSKGYAMTGWRLGYIGAPTWIAKACTKMQGQFTSATCSVTQRAAITALTSDLTTTIEMRDAFLKRRNLVLALMESIPGLQVNVPEGAFYVFPNASAYFGTSDGTTKIENIDDLCMYLLHSANVSLVTGSAFGNANCFRLSYAASEENLVEALKRIKEALIKLS